MSSGTNVFALLIPWAISMYVLYWAIRRGVADGVLDAHRYEAEEAQETARKAREVEDAPVVDR